MSVYWNNHYLCFIAKFKVIWRHLMKKKNALHIGTYMKYTQHQAKGLMGFEVIWWCCCFESFEVYCIPGHIPNNVSPLGHQCSIIITCAIMHLIRMALDPSIEVTCIAANVLIFWNKQNKGKAYIRKLERHHQIVRLRLFWNRTQIVHIILMSSNLS